jgi:hypothetical protein
MFLSIEVLSILKYYMFQNKYEWDGAYLKENNFYIDIGLFQTRAVDPHAKAECSTKRVEFVHNRSIQILWSL